MHRFQSTGFTNLLLEYLDVDEAIESEHVTPCSCFGDSTSTFFPSALASKVLICKQRGIQTLKERTSQRQRIRDVRYYEAIDRLEKLHTSDEVFCHNICYSEFTYQKQIKISILNYRWFSMCLETVD
jgi:hypothetical protein